MGAGNSTQGRTLSSSGMSPNANTPPDEHTTTPGLAEMNSVHLDVFTYVAMEREARPRERGPAAPYSCGRIPLSRRTVVTAPKIAPANVEF